MKAKVKLDLGSIKKWLFEHGEKVVFGLMVVLFLGFAYYGVRRETLDESKQPERLQAVAQEARNKVENSKWDPNAAPKIVDFEQRTHRKEVAPDAFAMHVPLNIPLANPKARRGDPKLFNVEELQVVGGNGTFALKGEATPDPAKAGAPKPAGGGDAPAAGGKGGLRGSMRAGAGGGQAAGGGGGGGGGQRKAGQKGFPPGSTAKLEARAFAIITGLVPIEKQSQEYARLFSGSVGSAERNSPRYGGARIERQTEGEKEWKKIAFLDKDFEGQWEGPAGEVVSGSYLDPALTRPLGPLVYVDWVDLASHPKVPLAGAEEQAAVAAAPEPAKEPEKSANDEPANEFDGVVVQRPTAPPPEKKPAEDASKTPPPPIPYRLLRIFDYTVEPNKKYRYRVQLALENPNFKMLPHQLNDPTSAAKPYRFTDDWSEPTAFARIPQAGGVLAGNVEGSTKGEPAAKLRLTTISQQGGIKATTDVKGFRGAALNTTVDKVFAERPNGGEPVPLENVPFTTGMVVVDIYGGKVLPGRRKDTSPGEVLLLDSQGNLQVRSELEDRLQYEQSQPPTRETEKKEKKEKGDKKDREKKDIPGDTPKKSMKKSLKGGGK